MREKTAVRSRNGTSTINRFMKMVLVPFLLLTAVFSRINILELTLPSVAKAATPADPKFRLEVIVRKIGLELTNGQVLIAAIPNVDGAYDLATLSQMVVALKRDYPDANEASVLLEPEIEYDHLIQVMDVVRSAEVASDSAVATAVALDPGSLESVGSAGSAATPPAASLPPGPDAVETAKRPVRVALFTEISVGDAP